MGCKISKGDFFFLLRVFFFLFFSFFFLYGPQVDPFFFSLFLYLSIEWQEVTKRFRPVRLGVGGVFLKKHLLQAI